MNIDNLADHPNQVDKSPYAYAWNDPIYYNDPDGNCPECWDFIKGFVGEIVDTAKSAFDSAGTVSTVTPGQASENIVNEIEQAVDVVENPVENAQEAVEETVSAPIDNVDKLVNGNAEEKGAAVAAIAISYVAKKAGVKVPKSPRGKGSVPPAKRDPKRAFSKKQKQQMQDRQNGQCPNCGDQKSLDQMDGHHLERHADGGSTTLDNGVNLCKDCHKDVHKK